MMHKTVLEFVCRRNISQKHTICRVLPSPMECANIQPKPVDVEKRCTDSIMLSNRNLTPPICKGFYNSLPHGANLTCEICENDYYIQI